MPKSGSFAEAFWSQISKSPVIALSALFSSSDSDKRSSLVSRAKVKPADHQDRVDQTTDLFTQLRPVQWLKNALLFLPLLAAHTNLGLPWIMCGLAVVAFSCLASAIYIINDLTDLDADRRHPVKCNRPLAAGKVSIRSATSVSVLLLIAGFALSAFVGASFLAVAVAYVILTTLYSFGLKRIRVVDIVFLTGLYAIRVLAGAVAVGVPPSGWFFGFVFPVFLALASSKRLTEVVRLEPSATVPGRSYRSSDKTWLVATAWVSAFLGVAVFAAYAVSPAAIDLYAERIWLFAAAIPLAIWMIRMVSTAASGKQDFDPISFAIKDKISLACVASAFLLVVMAA
ncbi:MAG: UbiA family prenyltransferase [Pseudomonadota bacterium]